MQQPGLLWEALRLEIADVQEADLLALLPAVLPFLANAKVTR